MARGHEIRGDFCVPPRGACSGAASPGASTASASTRSSSPTIASVPSALGEHIKSPIGDLLRAHFGVKAEKRSMTMSAMYSLLIVLEAGVEFRTTRVEHCDAL